jgi:exportin-2 (importin alpha re-exporter)
LNNKNPQISTEIYHLINKIIKRYRIEFKSYELYEEIKQTIREIASIMTEDGIACINFLFAEPNNKAGCFLYMTMLKHILNIFYSLMFQDFPEFFEDNLKSWMGILKGAIDFNIPLDDRQILILYLKAKRTAMMGLNLCCNSYSEDITEHHNDFLPSVWNLVNFVKQDENYSKLVRELLDYYKILFQYNRTTGFSSETVQHLVNNLIIPNMRMTDKEFDDFEDNPVNFLKVELEEADMDSSNF